MPTYRTPDVYVEEISVFPPSVAEVATAVPAFVGYTAQATRSLPGDLKKVPTRITSLLEYQQLFGGAPKLDISKVLLDDGGNFQRVEMGSGNTRHLFDAIRLFYDNGGGPCYIVSVGDYDATPDKADLTAGLDEVAKVDEPTILLAPDAASLQPDDLANVQQKALAQCGKLGDRVALLDPAYYDSKAAHATSIQALRDKMGINSLKYGAAYAPWLRIAYPKAVGFADLTAPTTKLYKGSQPVDISTLTSEPDLQTKITRLKQVLADQPKIESAKTTLLGGSFTAKQDALLLAYKTSQAETQAQALFGFLMDAARAIDGLVTSVGKVSNGDLTTAIQGQITTLAGVYAPVVNVELELKAALASYTVQQTVGATPSATQWGTTFSAAAAEVLERHKPAVVSFHFGLPEASLVQRVKSWGSRIVASATTVKEALWLQAHGADAVIAQGLEAGGWDFTRWMDWARSQGVEPGRLFQWPQNGATPAWPAAVRPHPAFALPRGPGGRLCRATVRGRGHRHDRSGTPARHGRSGGRRRDPAIAALPGRRRQPLRSLFAWLRP